MATLPSMSDHLSTSPPDSAKGSPDIMPISTTTPTAANGTITPPPEAVTHPVSTLQLCIAHFNEDLSWLSTNASNCSVYSKSEPPEDPEPFANSTRLPNIGRETHTYLTHIVRNYDSLPHVTLFLQGNIHDINEGTPAHTDLTLPELLSTALHLTPGAVLPIGAVKTFSSFSGIPYKKGWLRRRGGTLKRSSLTPRAFWTWLFTAAPADDDTTGQQQQEATPVPREVRFVQGACFAVTKEAIRARPLAWWRRLLGYFEDLGEVNPEEGHYMERMWYAVFAPDVAIVPRVEGEEEGEDEDGSGPQASPDEGLE